jgi:putative RNA 2'-phosphotransferase
MSRDTDLSRKLSWLLRHGAIESGLDMSPAGWTPVAQVLSTLGVTEEALRRVVDRNSKLRFEWQGDMIRASQGHSRAGTPVTVEALEASWDPVEPSGRAWHGTKRSKLDSIRREGINPGDRTHVHLAASPDSQRGKRSDVDVLLEIDISGLSEEGLTLYRAPNDVLLVRRVPPGLITEVRN